jgi:glycosyltransferase involved in cell wall biosynthesis
MAVPLRILHLHSSFSLGGKEARAVRLMNAWGDRARHVIVSGAADALGARERIDKGIAYEIAQDPPPLAGRPSVARYEAIARFMRPFDLVLTYNWGAIDGVMARRVFGKGAPPLIHHEDGFDADEAGGLKAERNMYRRVALPAAAALVVPSCTLETIALRTWKQPPERVHRITSGVATARYAAPPDPRGIPGLTRREDEVVIGAVAGLRPVKNLPMLVRACGGLRGRFRLVIVGEGPEEEAIRRAAAMMGIADRLVMPGLLPRSDRFTGLFDIAALSSSSEQVPLAVLEAMAAGLPVVATPVGDVPGMVAEANLPYVTDATAEVQLRDRLQILLDHPDVRAAVGAANRAKAQAEFDEGEMIRRYADLYARAAGRPGALS